MPANLHCWQLCWSWLIVIILKRTLRYLLLHVNHFFLESHRIALLNDPILTSCVITFKHANEYGLTSVLRCLEVSILGWGGNRSWSYRRHTREVIWWGADTYRLVRTLGYLSHFKSLTAMGAFVNRDISRCILLILIFDVLKYLLRLWVLSFKVPILHLRVNLYNRLKLKSHELLKPLGRIRTHWRLRTILILISKANYTTCNHGIVLLYDSLLWQDFVGGSMCILKFCDGE